MSYKVFKKYHTMTKSEMRDIQNLVYCIYSGNQKDLWVAKASKLGAKILHNINNRRTLESWRKRLENAESSEALKMMIPDLAEDGYYNLVDEALDMLHAVIICEECRFDQLTLELYLATNCTSAVSNYIRKIVRI